MKISDRTNYKVFPNTIDPDLSCTMWLRKINGIEYMFQRIERPDTVALFAFKNGKFVHHIRYTKTGG